MYGIMELRIVLTRNILFQYKKNNKNLHLKLRHTKFKVRICVHKAIK